MTIYTLFFSDNHSGEVVARAYGSRDRATQVGRDAVIENPNLTAVLYERTVLVSRSGMLAMINDSPGTEIAHWFAGTVNEGYDESHNGDRIVTRCYENDRVYRTITKYDTEDYA